MFRLTSLIPLLAALAACDADAPDGTAGTAALQETAEAAPRETPDVSLDTGAAKADASLTSSIDWAAARADRTASGGEAEQLVQAQSGGVQPPVPILLPTGIVSVQSATGGGPVFRQMSDGYVASYPGALYDIVVNGTNQVAAIDGQQVQPRGEPVFTATVAGAQVALSRYGADYLVEFECHETDEETGTCIGEAEALQVAESLVVAGSR